MRTFISIEIPEEVKGEILKIQDRLPDFVGKKTDLENLHLTLKFLGEISEEKVEQVKERLRRVNYGSFESELGYVGVFDNRKSRKYNQQLVVWLQLTNCKGLQKKVDEALTDIFEKEKRFMSHLTIARVKAIKNKEKFLEQIKSIEVPKIEFVVDKFRLKESVLLIKGPKYRDIEGYELGKYTNERNQSFI